MDRRPYAPSLTPPELAPGHAPTSGDRRHAGRDPRSDPTSAPQRCNVVANRTVHSGWPGATRVGPSLDPEEATVVTTLGRQVTVDLLQLVDQFGNCTQEQLSEVARLAECVQVGEGEALTREGRIGREFFLILSGSAGVTQRGRRVNTLGPGDFFGELAAMNPGPRNATVTALSDLDVLIIGPRRIPGHGRHTGFQGRAAQEHGPAVAHRRCPPGGGGRRQPSGDGAALRTGVTRSPRQRCAGPGRVPNLTAIAYGEMEWQPA